MGNELLCQSKHTLHTVFGIFDVKVVVSAIDQKAKSEYEDEKESKKECKCTKCFDGKSFKIIRVLRELFTRFQSEAFKTTLTLGFLRQKARAPLVLSFLQIEFCKKSIMTWIIAQKGEVEIDEKLTGKNYDGGYRKF